ncbi:helix-turn-helix domain-containing protein [Thalassolituus hydrocarboniclasticus]|uniref:XRE family transcriptional regulator n=1 Tax=Thalassolituus hydrocarboniclasticus TaxID=2742796 RepID=A0ABY6AE76_9GAMM|nr:helix-turn-helix domain-containing protein [Thalassolituus hydrocarboniclasticus]UXD88957.1 XRE family transcriptional regulator [Thalassolituus hydrocarboniclasticus]
MEDSRIILVDNAWASCSASSEEADFKRERVRLLIRVRERIVAAGWTPGEAAARLSLNDKQLQALMDGRASEFDVKQLIGMTSKLSSL